MNKQEVIDDIENAIPDFILNDYQRGKEAGLSYALELVEELDEPEKAVLSKEEAEWLEHLKLIANSTHCQYVITRQGWGYHFEFCSHGKKYKLSCANKNDGDENELTKNRLVNALIYGYEVEKEKLYTVEIPNPNGLDYLMLQKDRRGKISVAWYCTDRWREDERVRLTEAEIKKDFDWAWQFAKDVEE